MTLVQRFDPGSRIFKCPVLLIPFQTSNTLQLVFCVQRRNKESIIEEDLIEVVNFFSIINNLDKGFQCYISIQKKKKFKIIKMLIDYLKFI